MTPRPAGASTAFSYIRFSTPEQAQGDSLRRQTEAARAYAERHGLALDDHSYRDLGVSGFKGKNIEEGALGAFIAAVEQGKVKRGSTLLVEDLDRISRQRPMAALRSFERLLELGVVIVTLQDGRRYTKESLDDLGSLITSIVTMHRANQESALKAKRVADSWEARRKAAAGDRTPMTGRIPAWLKLERDPATGRKRFVVDKERAAIVKRIFQLRLGGLGPQGIARKLNLERVPPMGPSGKYSHVYVKKILFSGAVVGTVKLKDGSEVTDYYPAIILRAMWLRAQPRTPGKSYPNARTNRNLFNGLLRCASCGSPMHFVNHGPKANQGTWIVCSARREGTIACKAKSWQYPRFESLVLGALWSTLDWKKMLPEMRTSALEDLEEREAATRAQLETLKQRKARILDAIESGGEVASLATRLRELEAQEANLSQSQRELEVQLETEQERARGMSRETKRLVDLFADWSVNTSQDHGARQQMASALADVFAELRVNREKATVDVVFRTEWQGRKWLALPMAELEGIERTIQKRAMDGLMIPTGGAKATKGTTKRKTKRHRP